MRNRKRKFIVAFGTLAVLDALILAYALTFAVWHAIDESYKFALAGMAVAVFTACYMVRNIRDIRRIGDSETAEVLRRLRDAANREAGGSPH